MKRKKLKSRKKKIQKLVDIEYDKLSSETDPQLRLAICNRIKMIIDSQPGPLSV